MDLTGTWLGNKLVQAELLIKLRSLKARLALKIPHGRGCNNGLLDNSIDFNCDSQLMSIHPINDGT